MDLGPALKVASAPAGAPPPAVISAMGPIVPNTELPASQVVLPPGAVARSDLQPDQVATRGGSADLTERRVTIDADTQELVRQSVDSRTNAVVDQYPDRTMLALKAYFERLSGNAATSAAANDTGHAKVAPVQA